MRLLILSLLLTLNSFMPAQSQSLTWIKQLGGTSADFGYSIAVDSAGNVYATGSFEGTADFDPGTGIYNLTSAG